MAHCMTPSTQAGSSILNQDVSSPDDDFFELGGHSLRAIMLMVQINNAFGC